ncbi:Fatty acid desaturase 4, chloroplastic [Sarracenia purpurea var. burkii]
MSIFSSRHPHHHPLSSQIHAISASFHHQCLVPMRVSCSTAATPTKLIKPKPKPHYPVIEPPNLVAVALPPPVKRDDPSLQSTWSHRTWVATGCTAVAVSLAKCVTAAADSHMWLEPILAGLVGYVVADLGSGVYHWAIDNYGGATTPVFGSQIEAFQGHHRFPWTITKRQFANNLHALARFITFAVLPLDLACDGPILHGFVAVCSGCIMFSQQFHAWAHGTQSRLPPLVVALQDAGVIVSRSEHAAHHRPPYNNNYCIVSGVWNEFLAEKKVFEALEMVLFFKLGVRPRSWSEPNPDWTQETQTHPSPQITLH